MMRQPDIGEKLKSRYAKIVVPYKSNRKFLYKY